ncbi:MAG: polysaccharide biosynthesis C-terminal domain-containing protein, partial [Candidatus Odinarchaeota archaeon]
AGNGIAEIIIVTILVETLFALVKFIRTIFKFRLPSKSTTAHVKSKNIRKRLIRYAAIMIALPLVNFIIWKRSENYLIGLFRSLEEVGFYNLAYSSSQNMLEKANQLIGEMGIAAYAEVQVKGFSGLKKACTMHAKFLYIYALPIALGGIVLAEKFIIIFYTEAMRSSILPFQILLIAFGVGLLGAPMHTALNVLERNDLILKINTVSAVALVVTQIILITQFGILGAVFGVLIFQIANNGVFFYISYKYVGGNFLPFKNLAKYMLSGLLMALILLIGDFFLIKELFTFMAFVLIGTGVYLLGLKIVKAFDSEDLNVISQSDFPLKNFILKFYG